MAISYVTAASLDGTQSGSAPIYGARAWVNFNGTGTVAIRASGNVSSITDNGAGDYTVNFTTAMPDVNYAISVAGQSVGNNTIARSGQATTGTTGAVRVFAQTPSNTSLDTEFMTVAIFR
jgi:hypothetical protein